MKITALKRLSLLLAAALSLSMLLVGCGGESAYSVKVQDALGTPYTEGVVVVFKKDGAQAGMQVVGADGTATKKLPKGNYTVELNFTDSNTTYRYDASAVKLTAKKREATVTLAVQGKPTDPLSVGEKQVVPYVAKLGCTYAELGAERTYFLFSPTVAGKYEFSLPGSNGTIGYYGAPHFVQANSVAEVKDNKFTIDVKTSMIGTGGTGTTTLVIGVDPNGDKDVTLAIQRLGEPDHTIEDEPWTIYQKKSTLSKYTLPDGATLKEFDLKAATYNLVLGTDGYYHLNTAAGPLVLMRLAKKSKYLDSFKDILDRSDVNKYFYDADGNFVKKERYSDCLLEYIAVADEAEGVYPLTEDLKYIVQQRGDYSGWFDADATLYLFKDQNGVPIPGMNTENLWLFMCCYLG